MQILVARQRYQWRAESISFLIMSRRLSSLSGVTALQMSSQETLKLSFMPFPSPFPDLILLSLFFYRCVKHVGQDVQLPAHRRHLLAICRGVHQWFHQHSRVCPLSPANFVHVCACACACLSPLLCTPMSSVCNEEVTVSYILSKQKKSAAVRSSVYCESLAVSFVRYTGNAQTANISNFGIM